MKHLKILRKEIGKKQEQLGEIFGLSGASITGYETGRRYPDMDTIIKMSQYFNVSADYMLDLTESRFPPGTILGITEEEAAILNGLSEMPDEYREALKTILRYSKAQQK